MKMKYINYSMKQIESAGKIGLNILRYLHDNFLFFSSFISKIIIKHRNCLSLPLTVLITDAKLVIIPSNRRLHLCRLRSSYVNASLIRCIMDGRL